MTIHQDWDKADVAGLASLQKPEMAWFKGSADVPRGMPASKRMFDIGLALLLLVPLSIVMAVFALVLLIAQGRPIFTPRRAWRRRRDGSCI